MPQRETLAVFLFRELGYRKGTKVAAFIAAWGIYSDQVPDGEGPYIHGYTKYWKQNQANTYRELHAFHEVFPDDATPQRLWDIARKAVKDRKTVAVATAQVLPAMGEWS